MSGPTLLITRPEADARQFAAEAEASGFCPIFEPLLKIEPLPPPPLPRETPQAILFTSANGVRVFTDAYGALPCLAYAVGDATARTASAAGFGAVQSAGGDVHALAALADAELDPSAGILIHAAGESVAGDLQSALSKLGFNVQRLALYRAVKASALSASLASLVAEGGVDHAAFFSPRTAAAFVKLALSAGIRDKMSATDATALSPNVALELSALKWRSINTASQPTQKALLAKLLQVQQGRAGSVSI